MARLPRLALAGRPHYVLQRGHNGSPIFVDADDRQAYLLILKESIAAAGIALHAYALGDTEVRLLVTPSEADGVGRLMQAVGRRYVAGFNRRHGRSGTLWSGRFRSTVVDDTHVIDCIRHVETHGDAASRVQVSQVPQGSTSDAWTSASHHAGSRASPLIKEHPRFWTLGNTPFDREAQYRRLLAESLDPALATAIDEAVEKGWPLGSVEFSRQLAAETARRLHPLKAGRPRVVVR